jgi:hypothetical protein
VDVALTPFFGTEPEHDEDDDIPVVSGSALVFVRVLESMPAIELFSALVHGITDRDRAAFEVAVLNRDETFLKFVLVDDAVMAYLHLPAYPFAPEHLRTMLSVMSQSVDTLDDDLAPRVGGHRTFENGSVPHAGVAEDADEPDEGALVQADTDPVHPAMMTLLQLDADAPGSLTPELVASVCSFDRDLTLELISWNSRQETAWRQARDQALFNRDEEEAQVCEAETGHAEQMVNLLRRALRLIVERQLGRDLEELGYAVARRQPARRTRPERDAPLPGTEPVEEIGLFEQP